MNRLKSYSETVLNLVSTKFVTSNCNKAKCKNKISNMKKLILSSLLFTSFFLNAQEKPEKKQISIHFKNNSILPRKYTFVTYWTSDRTNNATTGLLLAPYASKTVTDVVGTELFLADDKQINTVMSGKKIDGKAFWVFKLEDDGKTINLRKN